MLDTAVKLMARAATARREDRLEDARRDYEDAVVLCRQSSQPELIRALKGLGQIERDLGRSDLALVLYGEAVDICRTINDPLTLAHTVRHLGDIHRESGRPDLAEPCLLEALAIYRGHDETNPLDLANAIRPLAILKQEEGAVEESRELWEEARKLYAAVNVREGVAESTARMAQLHRKTS